MIKSDQLLLNGEFSLAAYADLDNGLLNSVSQRASLVDAGMTDSQAISFASQFKELCSDPVSRPRFPINDNDDKNVKYKILNLKLINQFLIYFVVKYIRNNCYLIKVFYLKWSRLLK